MLYLSLFQDLFRDRKIELEEKIKYMHNLINEVDTFVNK